ncbi:hypothetical protein ACUU3R_004312 [Providencia rettgeri]|nr:hypothetical protein [Providencia rettgeri]
MDYSKCNFVSVLSCNTTNHAGTPMMRVNAKSGFASISKPIHEGKKFILVDVDFVNCVVRLSPSQSSGSKLRHEVNTAYFYMPKAATDAITKGFHDGKSKIIDLEKGHDGAWYGRFN